MSSKFLFTVSLTLVASLIVGCQGTAKLAEGRAGKEQSSFVESDKISTSHFVITYKDISFEQAAEFSEKAEKAFSDVTKYLGKQYKRKIEIDISNKYRIPGTTKNQKILIPANRIRGDAGGPPEIAGRGPAIAHEITHIIAPSGGKQNRYLDEGLAVFIQEKFGRDKSYPNMGIDVHELTARLIRSEGKTIPLKKVEEARRSSMSGNLRRLAYLQEGSFARYLIEKYGLKNFMIMYEGKSYKKVYKKSFEDLEKEWVDFIKGVE